MHSRRTRRLAAVAAAAGAFTLLGATGAIAALAAPSAPSGQGAVQVSPQPESGVAPLCVVMPQTKGCEHGPIQK